MEKKEIKEKLKVDDDTEKKLKKYLKTKKGKKTKLYLVLGFVFLALGLIFSVVELCLGKNYITLGSFDIIYLLMEWFYNFGCVSFIIFFYIFFLDMFDSKDIKEEQRNEINKIDNVINFISKLLLLLLFEHSVTNVEGSELLIRLSSCILNCMILYLGTLFIIKLLYLITTNYDANKKSK